MLRKSHYSGIHFKRIKFYHRVIKMHKHKGNGGKTILSRQVLGMYAHIDEHLGGPGY